MVEEIQKKCVALQEMLSSKGLYSTHVWCGINWLSSCNVSFMLNWRTDNKDGKSYDKIIKGVDLDGVYSAAVSFINDMPSAEQAKKNAFMAKMAELIEMGKDIGVEGFVNPLTEMMKTLSENALEDLR